MPLGNSVFEREPTEIDADKLIDEAAQEGISVTEVVRRLMLSANLSNRWMDRAAGSGGGVQAIRLVHQGLEITTWEGERLTFFGGDCGFRWRLRGSLISRSDAEAFLGAWPGYVTALEDIYDHLLEEHGKLEKRKRQIQDELVDAYMKQREEIESRFANERHPQLRRWRESNPSSSAARPDVLRSVRNIKRLEVSQPCHVYFLLREGEVVYVGQSSAPWPARVLQHLKERTKEFDDVWYLEVDRPSLDRVERHYIDLFGPVYNGGASSAGRKSSEPNDVCGPMPHSSPPA